MTSSISKRAVRSVSYRPFNHRDGVSDASFAVVMARTNEGWLFVRQKSRHTWELPGGRREEGESIVDTARRELFEETGVAAFHLVPIEEFTVHLEGGGPDSVGLLCYAEIDRFEELPPSEIAEIIRTKACPEALTYKVVQAELFSRVERKARLLEKLAPYHHIIWDWNGTLVDDIGMSVSAIGVLLEENKLPPLSREKYREVFGFPIARYYEGLGFDFSKQSLSELAVRFHDEYNRLWPTESALFEDVRWHLSFLRLHKKQSILSAAAQWHLDSWVRHHAIEEFFHHIFGIADDLGTSKVARGRELIAHSGIDPEGTIIVGDTDHDLEVARELGIHALLIGDGHQAYHRLANLHDNTLESRHG